MRIELSRSVVRDYAASDLHSLVQHANNRNVSIQLRDRFPYPYREEHGRQFLERVLHTTPVTNWAIEVDGEVAGGIGVMLQTDVERVSAEIGYWLGEAHWGKGIVTEAVKAVTRESFRLLEKAGYSHEGTMPRSAIKEGVIRDQLMYGTYRPF